MKTLVINVGSSSIKFKVYGDKEKIIFQGGLQRIGISKEAFKKIDASKKNFLKDICLQMAYIVFVALKYVKKKYAKKRLFQHIQKEWNGYQKA